MASGLALFAGDGNLTGSLPDIHAGSKLRELSLGCNQLTGTIPSTLSNAANLFIFNVTYNGLVGSIPPTLASIANLEYLDLSDNHLNGAHLSPESPCMQLASCPL